MLLKYRGKTKNEPDTMPSSNNQLKHHNRLPPFGTFQPILQGGRLFVAAMTEEGYGCGIVFWHKGIELVDAQMGGDITSQQTKGFRSQALTLLLGHHDNPHFGAMVQRTVVLQIDKANAHTIGLLNDEP